MSDGSTMRMLNDATQMILSSGTVHIDMEKQQKEAFIKSMLKIIRYCQGVIIRCPPKKIKSNDPQHCL